jgi:DNA-binding transcriptional MerR regulator
VNLTGAFTMEQAAKLSGLTKRQLAYWDKTNVFSPSLVKRRGHQPFGRVYSFQDIVALRTLALLRKRFSLEKLRNLGAWLKQRYDQPWSSIRFYVAGNEIVYEDPESQAFVSTQPVQQGALCIDLEPIAREASESLQQHLRKRDADDIGVIHRHRYTLRNDWIIGGTRIPVWIIKELHKSGYSIEGIIKEYPVLTRRDVEAALRFDYPAREKRVG